MNLGISGRTALVVGASRGIGLEVMRELRAEGCIVLGVARTMTGHNVAWDLMPEGAPETFCATLADCQPDIIVHVMGGSDGRRDALASASDYAHVWRLNLGVAIEINRAFVPLMQRNKWGRVIHLTSTSPEIRMGYCPYVSAKAALDGYVRSMGREVSKDGVVITALSLGVVHTEGRFYAGLDERAQEAYFDRHIPTHRFGRAEEVAKAVAFLASDHAAYMAGSIVPLDGGVR